MANEVQTESTSQASIETVSSSTTKKSNIKSSSESPEKQMQLLTASNASTPAESVNPQNNNSLSDKKQAKGSNKKASSLNGSAKNLSNFSSSDLYDYRYSTGGSNSHHHHHHHHVTFHQPTTPTSGGESAGVRHNGKGSFNNLSAANAVNDPEHPICEEEEEFDGLIYRDNVSAAQTMKMMNVLRKNRQLCDLILQLDDDTQDIYCHQIILACNSKYFMEVFTNYETEQTKNRKRNGNMEDSDDGVTSSSPSSNNGFDKKKQSVSSIAVKNHNSHHRQLMFCLSDSLKNFLNDDYRHHYAKIHSIVNHNSHYNHFHHSSHTSLNHHMDTIADQQNDDVHQLNHNLDYEALKICIDYLYTGKLKVPSYLLPHVYTLAYHLSFESIVEHCSQYLVQHLNPDNCLSIRSFALDESLIQYSTECIENNIEYILQVNNNSKSYLNGNSYQNHYSSNSSLSSLSARHGSLAEPDVLNQQQDQTSLSSSINLAHKDFNHLPRINIELVGLPSNKSKLPENIVFLTQLCMNWLVNELIDKKQAAVNGGGGGGETPTQVSSTTASNGAIHSLNELCDHLTMLYMNSQDHTLHDCCDMEATDDNFTDYINDYQKKCNASCAINASASSNGISKSGKVNGVGNVQRQISNSSGRFKSFKITDQELNAIGMATPIKLKVLHDNEIICTYQLNEQSFITICTLTGKLITLSVHLIPASSTSPTLANHPNVLRVNSHSEGEDTENGSLSSSQDNSKASTNLKGSSENVNGVVDNLQPNLTVCSAMSSSSLDLERLPKMQVPRASHGLIGYQNKLYIIGGYDRGECLSACEIYDPLTNTIEQLDPMHCRRGRAAVTWLGKDESIYVIGGSDGHEDLNSLEYYNLSKKEWKLIKFDYQLACTNLGAIACQNCIYLVGLKNEKNSARTICLKYEPDTNQFTRLANLNNGRSQSALVWLQNCTGVDFYLYVFGGYDQYRCLNSCEVYNINEDKWSVLPSMHEPRRGCGAAYHQPSNRIFIVGGTNGSQSLRTMEIFDVKTKKWSTGPELNIARTNVAIAFVGDVLFAVGGFDGKSFLKTIEYLNCKNLNDGWSLYYKPSDFDDHQ